MLFLVALLKLQLLITLHAYEVKGSPETASISSSSSSTKSENGSNSILANLEKTASNLPNAFAEGGSVPVSSSIAEANAHHREEHVVKDNTTQAANVNSNNNNNNKAKNVDKQVPSTIIKTKVNESRGNQDLEEGVAKKHDNHSVSTHKLDSFLITDIWNKSSMATSSTKPPMKPTVTVHGEGVKDTRAEVLLKNDKSKSNYSAVPEIMKVPVSSDRQKYIVPIVVVILSVPFVAIILSLIYKKGSDWWRYRHYRRMDFLINGMYDT